MAPDPVAHDGRERFHPIDRNRLALASRLIRQLAQRPSVAGGEGRAVGRTIEKRQIGPALVQPPAAERHERDAPGQRLELDDDRQRRRTRWLRSDLFRAPRRSGRAVRASHRDTSQMTRAGTGTPDVTADRLRRVADRERERKPRSRQIDGGLISLHHSIPVTHRRSPDSSPSLSTASPRDVPVFVNSMTDTRSRDAVADLLQTAGRAVNARALVRWRVRLTYGSPSVTTIRP